jgi:choline monooxygenase
MPGINATEAESAMWIHIFPNISLFLLPNHLFTLMLNPKTPGETLEYTDLLVHPDVKSIPNYEANLQELFQYWDRVNRQDFEAVQRVQIGISAKAYPGGRMCERFEEPLHRFQNMVIDRMVGKQVVPKGDEETHDFYFLSQNLKMEAAHVQHS